MTADGLKAESESAAEALGKLCRRFPATEGNRVVTYRPGSPERLNVTDTDRRGESTAMKSVSQNPKGLKIAAL